MPSNLVLLSSAEKLGRTRTLDISELGDRKLIVLRPGFASREWFDGACQLANIWPRIVLESAAPQTVVALARARYGVAIVPSPISIAREGVRVLPLAHRGIAIGKWAVIAWDGQRYLAPFGRMFIDEILAVVRDDYPGREHASHAPELPPPDRAEAGYSYFSPPALPPNTRRTNTV